MTPDYPLVSAPEAVPAPPADRMLVPGFAVFPREEFELPWRMVPADPRASMSLASVLDAPHGATLAAARSAGWHLAADECPVAPVLIEATPGRRMERVMDELPAGESALVLGEGWFSARVGPSTLRRLLRRGDLLGLHCATLKRPSLDHACTSIGTWHHEGGGRRVAETGAGVLIGVVDTGFDLSHPVFADDQGRLRVRALLVQDLAGDRAYTREQLARAWRSGSGPGRDRDGHGTHVASICGGSRFRGLEGVAPGAEYLLVQTDMLRTADAVRWILDQAGDRPCVINLSLGHHFGAHDGTDPEERLHQKWSRPGKIIVVAAGNERDDRIHVGGTFGHGQTHDLRFDLLRRGDGPPRATVTVWYAEGDHFDVRLIGPSGISYSVPLRDLAVSDAEPVRVELGRAPYPRSASVQAQISIAFDTDEVREMDLQDWRLRIRCDRAAVGRLDAWFENSGFARFRDHALLSDGYTVGLPATGEGSIAVGSHVGRTEWSCDLGVRLDPGLRPGELSRFSSLGPTRDRRPKPELSAPGHYVSGALAEGSRLAGWRERAHQESRVVTLEGTSMAAPVVAGVVALMLERRPGLTVEQARDVLTTTARPSPASAGGGWDPGFGYGMVDAAAALARL